MSALGKMLSSLRTAITLAGVDVLPQVRAACDIIDGAGPYSRPERKRIRAFWSNVEVHLHRSIELIERRSGGDVCPTLVEARSIAAERGLKEYDHATWTLR